MTLEQAAADLAISPSQLSRIERGLVESIDLAFALRVRDRFGIDPDSWFAREEKAA